MIKSQRVFWDDNGTLKDLSISLNDFRQGTETIAFVGADDYLYIASDLPFNHKWFEVSTANSNACAVSVDIWFGTTEAWVPAVDVIDRTSVSGVSLAQSGIIQWTTDREKGWHAELDSEDVTGIGTAAVGLYNMYWARFTFSQDWSVSTALDFVGQRFASDNNLFSIYPDLSNANILAAFETGKSDWNEQHFVAASHIADDLRMRNIIVSPAQILNHELFQRPAIHKVAEIVYRGMGRGYEDQLKDARADYAKTINKTFYDIDQNRDGNLSMSEKRISVGFMRR